MKWSPAAVVLDPTDAPDLPAVGEPKKDVWAVHRVVDSTIYERQVEAYGYVVLYTDERERKGILWVDRREMAVLDSCLSTSGARGVGAEDIAGHLTVSPEPGLKVVDEP